MTDWYWEWESRSSVEYVGASEHYVGRIEMNGIGPEHGGPWSWRVEGPSFVSVGLAPTLDDAMRDVRDEAHGDSGRIEAIAILDAMMGVPA